MHMPRTPVSLAERQTLNVTLVDTETTGLDPGSDEVIGIGLLCLRVQASTGRLESVVATSFQWREPDSMSAEAEATVGITRTQLKGRRFDATAIDRVLSVTDLVVAHNAAVDRPFLERLLPALADLPWACSLTDIAWRTEEGLEQASIDFLLSRHGVAPSSGSPEGDCHALAYVLAQPLPRSPCTGFRRLILAADAVTVECVLSQDEDQAKAAVEILAGLGFQNRGGRWRADCADDACAEHLEAQVIDHAIGNLAFAALKMWRVDARSRFTMRSLPAAG
jgi:DNA polymerase-3 subunit epsilon